MDSAAHYEDTPEEDSRQTSPAEDLPRDDDTDSEGSVSDDSSDDGLMDEDSQDLSDHPLAHASTDEI
ncbi:hypothetical protein FIE12Z_116, partial [Fusarium flagelliforme]